jgi:plastocyanin
MSRVPAILAALACSAVVTLGFAANADACDSPGKKIAIKVKVENGQPVVNPDTVNACEGDVIHWVFAGSKPFKVQFMGGDSPFDWPEGSKENSASIDGTVQPGAAKNGKSTPYSYDVEVDGVALDPKIIVDP